MKPPIEGMNKCPKCNSENIYDHSEFGLPLQHNRRCGDCGHTWADEMDNIKESVMDEKEVLCCKWAYGYKRHGTLPDKAEFPALQDLKYLPKKGKPAGSDIEYDVTFGHYGWAACYDWEFISGKILKELPPLTLLEIKELSWNCFLHIPVSPEASMKVLSIGKIKNNDIDKLIVALKQTKEVNHFGD